jgi:hypothetical protein
MSDSGYCCTIVVRGQRSQKPSMTGNGYSCPNDASWKAFIPMGYGVLYEGWQTACDEHLAFLVRMVRQGRRAARRARKST